MTVPIVLSIAGSDSGGGAGIQADLKTFHSFGTFGTTAITAITAQNTEGVRAIHAIPPAIVDAQIAAVAEDLRPAALKTGMLATRELVHTVARAIERHELTNFVLDPVMVATTGARLLDDDATNAILNDLMPLASVVTPNLDEASIMAGMEIEDVEDMRAAAERLAAAGARAVLLKGGHLTSTEQLVDVLLVDGNLHEWRHDRQRTTNTHGTGCTLAAAIAAGLALGHPLPDAVGIALQFVQEAMRSAPDIGHGSGPVNHLVRPVESRPAHR